MQRKWVLVAAGVAAVAILLVAGQLLLKSKEPPPGLSQTPPADTSLPTTRTGIIAPLPGGRPLPTIKPTGAAKPGDPLHPLDSSPPGLVAGLAVGRVPTGSAYLITFRPWGYGPANRIGQTVAVSVTKLTPIGRAPDISSLTRNPLLLTMDAKGDGDVAAGGVHSATLTLVADGDQIVPVLTNVEPQTP